MQVVTDGIRARYPNGLHVGVRKERSALPATWVVPQDSSLVPCVGDRAFIFLMRGHDHETDDQTMVTADFSLTGTETKQEKL